MADTKTVYCRDAGGYYTRPMIVYPNPKEPGKWLQPATAYDTEPPAHGAGEWPRGVAGEWVLVPDHRGELIHNAESRELATCDYLGDLKTGWALGELPFDLELAKEEKIKAIDTAVGAKITGGFISDALGTDHTYASDRDDQLNLIGAAQDGVALPYPCTDSAGEWAERQHTAAQIKLVLRHGAALKHSYLQQGRVLKAAVESAADESALNQIEIVIS